MGPRTVLVLGPGVTYPSYARSKLGILGSNLRHAPKPLLPRSNGGRIYHGLGGCRRPAVATFKPRILCLLQARIVWGRRETAVHRNRMCACITRGTSRLHRLWCTGRTPLLGEL